MSEKNDKWPCKLTKADVAVAHLHMTATTTFRGDDPELIKAAKLVLESGCTDEEVLEIARQIAAITPRADPRQAERSRHIVAIAKDIADRGQ